MIMQFIGVELDGPSSLKPRLASRVKDQAFKNGLIVMGISGTIDGVEGETTIICPVSLACIFSVVWYFLLIVILGIHRDQGADLWDC